MAEEALTFEWDELGEVERSEAVLETLDVLLHRLDKHIDLVARLDESNPHVVERVMQGCIGAVDLLYAGREDTCVDAAAYYQNSWEVDQEPAPAPLDVWARGAVLAKVPPKLPDKVKTGSSVASKSSIGRMTGKAVPSEDGQSATGDKTTRSKLGRMTSPSRDTSPNRQPTKPKMTKEEAEREDRLREELAIRRRQEEITQELLLADERARQQLAEMQKTLKGKEYSYDHKGEVVIMSKIDPDKLPKMLPKPGTTVHQKYVPAEPSESSVGSRAASRTEQREPAASSHRESQTGSHKSESQTGTVQMRGRQRRVSGETAYIELPNEGQPPPTETIKPNPGVTITSGRSVKKGAPPKREKLMDMSKRDFSEYIKKKGQYEKLPDTQGFAAQKSKRLAEAREQYTMALSVRQSQSRETTRSDTGPRLSEDEAGPLGLGVPSKAPPAWMKDGTPIPPPPPERKPKKGDVNKILTSSPDWGESKARRKQEEDEENKRASPTKPQRHPTVFERELTVGKVERRPRDRHFGYITERDLQEYQQH